MVLDDGYGLFQSNRLPATTDLQMVGRHTTIVDDMRITPVYLNSLWHDRLQFLRSLTSCSTTSF
jgi:hypothetical protein